VAPDEAEDFLTRAQAEGDERWDSQGAVQKKADNNNGSEI